MTADHMHLMDIPQLVGTPFAGGPMSQTFSALYWFERLFAERKPASILELGTGSGYLALFFGLHCPDATVTCDKVPLTPGGRLGLLYNKLGITLLCKDVLTHAAAHGLMATQKKPRFVLCDDGNKSMEFALFAPLLEPGDIIAVHDNPAEFKADAEEAQSIAKKYGLERWGREELDGDKTRLAVWIKP